MKKLNKKGFTLVELLAVIVVLALLMVVATTSIGTALNNAKKKALVTETQKVLKQKFEEEQSKIILDASYTAPTATVVTDGDFKYKITFNNSAQITSYCVEYPGSKYSINKTVTASNSVPNVATSDIQEGASYTACS